MDPVRQQILDRLERFGLRFTCPTCGYEGRHRPSQGRLRERRCPACGHKQLRSTYWIAHHSERWFQLQAERRAVVGIRA